MEHWPSGRRMGRECPSVKARGGHERDGDARRMYGPAVSSLKWSAVALCLLQGGYMVVDGVRALVVGSYITPGSGEHAGQLGPWARLVAWVGVEPESTGMRVFFVVLGVLWLVLAFGIATEAPWAWLAGMLMGIGTLWYLVPGTVVSVAVVILLLTPSVRRALGRS